MNNKKITRGILIFLVSGLLLMIFLYVFLIREWVKLMAIEQAPEFFVHWVELIYPRYLTEKHRFDPVFFIQKADQVIYRLTFVLFSVILFIYLYFFNSTFQQRVVNFWDKKTTLKNINILRICYSIISFYLVFDWIQIIHKIHVIKAFYQPVFLLKILGLPFPPLFILQICYGLLFICLVLIFFNYKPVWASSIFAFLFIFIQGYFFSFHKLDHTYATYNFGVILMPFLLYQVFISKQKRLDSSPAWPLIIIQLGVSLAYFMAGIEKVLVSGLYWFSPETLLFYLKQHDSLLYPFLNHYPWLVSLLSILVVVFEIGFILIVFFPRSKFFFIVCGILFHWSTYTFLGVGGMLSPWILSYIFLIDWGHKSLIIRTK